MGNILIIDDNKQLSQLLVSFAERIGHAVKYVLTLAEGIEAVSSTQYQVVFLDVRLPDGNGLDALPVIRSAPGLPEVIIITGEGDPEGAELAIKSGAWAYIEKPVTLENLELQLTRALQYHQEREKKPSVAIKREEIVGSSRELERCFDLMAQFAITDVNVLITGDTGTGKELFARNIHKNSPRAKNNFVVVDCAALPATLIGSILFGHEKGAFTGAEKSRTGLIKEADGGTLFLDEVGELPMSEQKEFLRVLQENRFRPIGSNKEVKSNFRLISATNRDLGKMIPTGEFRKDLYFRLQSFILDLPPLRVRTQDIKDLAMHYMVKICERHETDTKGFSPDFFETLMKYDWPGNVRELANTMERVLAVARFEPTLFPRHLPIQIRIHEARASVKGKEDLDKTSALEDHPSEMLPKLQEVREAALARTEKQYLNDLMMLTQRDIKSACRIAGISRSRLYHLLQKYSITRS